MSTSLLLQVNMELSVLDKERGNAIVRAATEVADGKLLNNFPLVIWRTGRGSHSNTTANEVGVRSFCLIRLGLRPLSRSEAWLGEGDLLLSP